MLEDETGATTAEELVEVLVGMALAVVGIAVAEGDTYTDVDAGATTAEEVEETTSVLDETALVDDTGATTMVEEADVTGAADDEDVETMADAAVTDELADTAAAPGPETLVVRSPLST